MSSASVSELLESRLSEFKELIAQPLPKSHDDIVALFRHHRTSLLDRADGLSSEALDSPANAAHLASFVDGIAAEIQRVSAAAKAKESASCDAAGVTGLGMITAGAVVFGPPGALAGFVGGVGLLLLAC